MTRREELGSGEESEESVASQQSRRIQPVLHIPSYTGSTKPPKSSPHLVRGVSRVSCCHVVNGTNHPKKSTSRLTSHVSQARPRMQGAIRSSWTLDEGRCQARMDVLRPRLWGWMRPTLSIASRSIKRPSPPPSPPLLTGQWAVRGISRSCLTCGSL
ncbi:hypothetical protein BO70DRAFT_82166 [Aspergillus heteromorphus CBS 117.55]|uniref:Uncharacterized protein n=1 Tax=Aspergillus heteromorphus CBS 117.55 TaxID=1448321 RepID=A0A317WX88_9EURO|nr:uncharacterized protein BO70DRAFT_82166 [Aspergillus heteromorphus CBS 117.55]PWY90963.1 hypothetical protein BO70DRAFT_82166 [Aspergillus heteromorphus CBS 117.55]